MNDKEKMFREFVKNVSRELITDEDEHIFEFPEEKNEFFKNKKKRELKENK